MICHAKTKHNVELTPSGEEKKKRIKKQLPDLPPYVPSPVDMAATSPYGTMKQQGKQTSWSEIEMFPHALTFSNMELVGVVTEIEKGFKLEAPVVQLTVHIAQTATTDDEELVVRCFGQDMVDLVAATVQEGSTVVVSGTLRMNPVLDSASGKYYNNPLVHVAMPTGSIFCLEGPKAEAKA